MWLTLTEKYLRLEKQTSRCVCKDVSRKDHVRQKDGSKCGVGVWGINKKGGKKGEFFVE